MSLNQIQSKKVKIMISTAEHLNNYVPCVWAQGDADQDFEKLPKLAQNSFSCHKNVFFLTQGCPKFTKKWVFNITWLSLCGLYEGRGTTQRREGAAPDTMLPWQV